MDTTFPTPEQRAFIENVNSFCKRKYGFPVYAKFSAAPRFQRLIFAVVVCSSYRLWSPEKTLINQFYVYVGRSEKQANAVASTYQKKEHDVYVGRFTSWQVAPEMYTWITPNFFLSHAEENSGNEFDMIRRIGILIHESFHHYVHRHDIGLKNYGPYVTMDEMSEEEVLAIIIDKLSVVEYLLEIDPNSVHLDKAEQEMKRLFEHEGFQNIYNQLQEVYENPSITVGLKRVLKKKFIGNYYGSEGIMRRPNNALFLRNYMYYGNRHMERYKKELIDQGSEEKRRTAIQNFAKQYWTKVKDR